jgi:hypothetical protein
MSQEEGRKGVHHEARAQEGLFAAAVLLQAKSGQNTTFDIVGI